MLKLQINDLIKILTVDEVGQCKDGRTFVRCSAMSFFDEDDTYMVLTAFGAVADMIADNHTGENMRRAIVNGRLEITTTRVKQKVKINGGASKTIMVPDVRFQILADSVRFIDKNRAGETNADLDDDDDVVEYEAIDEQDEEEIAATDGDVTIVDADEVAPRRTARTNSTKSRKNARTVTRVIPE